MPKTLAEWERSLEVLSDDELRNVSNGIKVLEKVDGALIGLVPVTYVKFDLQKEKTIIPDSELEPEIKKPEVDILIGEKS